MRDYGKRILTMGRNDDTISNTIPIKEEFSKYVSRKHCTLEFDIEKQRWLLRDGQWDAYAGKIQTLGLVSADDMSLNYVGLPSSTVWTDSFKEADYKQLVADMVDGKIKVSGDSSAEQPSATTAKINFQGNIK